MGRYDDALDVLGTALDLVQRTGRKAPEAYVRNNLVHLYYRVRRYGDAVAEALHDLGRREEARRECQEAGLELLHEARLLAPVEAAGYLAQPVPDTPQPIRNQL